MLPLRLSADHRTDTKGVMAVRLLTRATLGLCAGTLVLAAGGTSSLGLHVSPTATASAPLSTARLAGEFDVTTKVVTVSGIDTKRGSTDTGTWDFTPACSSGACKTRLKIDYGRFLTAEHTARITLKKAGKRYTGAAMTPLVECNFKDVIGKMAVRLDVVKGAWIAGTWRATKVAGKYEYNAPATTSGIYHCAAARITATVRGSLDT